MKLWEFTSTDPGSAWQSARVVAPGREEACGLLAPRIDRWLQPFNAAGGRQRPAPDILLRYAGEAGRAEPRVIDLLPRAVP